MDFEGSLNLNIVKKALEEKCKLIVVVNRIDLLPLGATSDRINKWVVHNLNKHMKREDYQLCLLSSKTGEGFKKIVNLFRHLEKEFGKDKRKPKVYVMGATNVGKSTFLNKLIDKTNYFPGKSKEKSQDRSELETLQEFMESTLTTSSLPGTTQGFIKISKAHIGFSLNDTPGIPNRTQLYTHLEDYQDVMSTIITKRVKPYNIQVRAGTSIWLGALARIDVLKKNGVCLTICVGEHVTIHKTTIEKAESVYEKQAGDLLRPAYSVDKGKIEWETHDIVIEDKGKDISIQGLGWVGVNTNGLSEMLLKIPKGVKYVVRDALMPFELKDKGLHRHPTVTINTQTRKNIALREKYKRKTEEFLNKTKTAEHSLI